MFKLWIENLGRVIVCLIIFRDLVSVPYDFIIRSNIDHIKKTFNQGSEI